jgi:hypothetical protein
MVANSSFVAAVKVMVVENSPEHEGGLCNALDAPY